MKKLLIALATLLFLWVIAPYNVLAAVTPGIESRVFPGTYGSFGTPSNQGLPATIQSVQEYDQGSPNLGGTVGSQLTSTMNIMTCLIGGCLYATEDQQGFNNGGAIKMITGSMGTMIGNPPASSRTYAEYIASNIRIPGAPAPAYAQDQGIGYRGLNPILGLWTLSRNIAYLIFSVIFVVIGFMIIFRVKIDPKTVITVQSALPKIILALILITFSYAIVGFMIDLMYVLIGLVVNLFVGVLSPDQIRELKDTLPAESIFGVFGSKNFWSVTTGASGAIGNMVSNLISGNPVSDVIGKILGGGANALMWLIFSAALLIALFKTWFSLLGAYIQIILGLISAPLFLAMEAIPGRGTLGIWLRNMFANILVFPFVALMLLVGYALTAGYGNASSGTAADRFVPPFLGGNDPGAVAALIGLGVILTMPKAINILQEVLKTPPFKYGSAWQEPLKIPVGAAQGLAGVGVSGGRGFVSDRIFGTPAAGYAGWSTWKIAAHQAVSGVKKK